MGGYRNVRGCWVELEGLLPSILFYCPFILFLWQKYVKLVNPRCRGRLSRSKKSLGKGQDMRRPERWTLNANKPHPAFQVSWLGSMTLMRVLRICFIQSFLRSTLVRQEPCFKDRALPFQGWYVFDWHSMVFTRHHPGNIPYLCYLVMIWKSQMCDNSLQLGNHLSSSRSYKIDKPQPGSTWSIRKPYHDPDWMEYGYL